MATRSGFCQPMATTIIGQVEAFQPGVDDWEQYTERLEQYFVANDIVDADKKLAHRCWHQNVRTAQ